MADSDVMTAINNLIGQVSNVPTPTIPTLNVNMPSANDVNSQWMQFLTKAAQDPTIVSYYENLLNKAVGDTNLAISYIEQDYQNNTRDISQNLAGTLSQEENTQTTENQSQANTLNQRGIAMTQATPVDSSSAVYAGGGQAATEVGQLRSTQDLRKEAEIRSAQQGIQTAGVNQEKSITSANQQLDSTATSLQGQKQADVLSEAQQNMGLYTSGLSPSAQSAVNKQKSDMTNGTGSSSASGAPPYKPDTVNQTVSYNGQTYRGQPGGDWALA
jgi:hypothetical protein